MHKPTALIADDEPLLAEYLRQRLGLLWPELDLIGIARNGIEAAAMLSTHQPDVAFLDIKMPGLTGLEVARSANDTHCVFITAYDQYAIEAFERNATDYLLKPVADERLAATIDRLKQKLANGDHALSDALLGQLRALLNTPAGQATPIERLKWIRAGIGQEVKLIPVEEVCYFQASDKYTSVVTTQGEYLIRMSLKELTDQLDPDAFWQVHRGTLVNVREIREASRDLTGKITLSLKHLGHKLPVSRAFNHLFKQM
ncbi:LytR/AlgR family response regulator transcription factor [Parachitinimonas caeni]|uniref:LytTR family DNA-binding domain-containing protein n=1 Tax=Parachitinimonas caeni TaxID=3031301 RepID=A0ABT7DTY7_9NEIS|nr:LytTR family DNA-binding domain-containing protein [Parachitinimonas caeni]MDK2123523.1 LytTR family DNA-binding domain-containing protein [Parachitinimonas caeni]